MVVVGAVVVDAVDVVVEVVVVDTVVEIVVGTVVVVVEPLQAYVAPMNSEMKTRTDSTSLKGPAECACSSKFRFEKFIKIPEYLGQP